MKNSKVWVRTLASVLVIFMLTFFAALVPGGPANAATSVLVSQGKPTTAISSETGHDSLYAVDGSTSTYWGAPLGTYNMAWWQVDLQSTYKLTSINIRNYVDGVRYYKYYIRGSLDGIHWFPLAGKNNNNVATDAGDTYSVSTVARYLRVNFTYNSANSSVHISEFKAYGYAQTLSSTPLVSVQDFDPDQNSYYAGNNSYLNYTLKNNSSSAVTLQKVTIRKAGFTNPLVYDETVIYSTPTDINAGATFSQNNALIWIIPSYTGIGEYGFYLSIELSNGEIYENYGSFTRVKNSSDLLTYNVTTNSYNGLNVFALDGGMSAEASVEKSMENLESSASHSWFIQAAGGPNSVWSTRSFMADSIQKTVDLYNNKFGSTTTFDTVVLSTGNCYINYMSRVVKAPVLPVQFLVTVNTYKELRQIIDYTNAQGIPAYSTLGYDGSMPGVGVAWVKLLDLPPAYKTFLVQHNVKNVIIGGTSNATGSESMAKKAIEPGTNMTGTNPGDIFVMFPQGGVPADYDSLTRDIKDINEQNLGSLSPFSDWESGMLESQISALAQTAKNSIGTGAQAISVTADSPQKLYDFGTYSMVGFFKKNEAVLTSDGGPAIRGVVLNPYLIAHPAYETKIRYIPAMFWQGNDPSWIAGTVVNTSVRNAIAAYFPNINFNSLNFWMDFSSNFGGAACANNIETQLRSLGLTNITRNDYTKNEIWNPGDGMSSPVESCVNNVLIFSSPQGMKDFNNSLTPLTIQDVINIGSVCSEAAITIR